MTINIWSLDIMQTIRSYTKVRKPAQHSTEAIKHIDRDSKFKNIKRKFYKRKQNIGEECKDNVHTIQGMTIKTLTITTVNGTTSI